MFISHSFHTFPSFQLKTSSHFLHTHTWNFKFSRFYVPLSISQILSTVCILHYRGTGNVWRCSCYVFKLHCHFRSVALLYLRKNINFLLSRKRSISALKIKNKPWKCGKSAQPFAFVWLIFSLVYTVHLFFYNLWISLVIHYTHKSVLWYESIENETTRPSSEMSKWSLLHRIPSTKCKQLSAVAPWKHL